MGRTGYDHNSQAMTITDEQIAQCANLAALMRPVAARDGLTNPWWDLITPLEMLARRQEPPYMRDFGPQGYIDEARGELSKAGIATTDDAVDLGPKRRDTICRSCHKEIVWLVTEAGKTCPVDAETVGPNDKEYRTDYGHVSHFATCSDAARFSKKKKKAI